MANKACPTKFVRSAGAGRILGLTPAGVRLLRTTGKLQPAIVTEDGEALYDVETVEALRRQRESRRAAAGGAP